MDIFEEALAELAAKERVASSPYHQVETVLAGKPEDIMSDSTSTLIGSETTSGPSEDNATYSVEGIKPVKLLVGSYQAKYVVEKPVNQAAAGFSGLTQKTRVTQENVTSECESEDSTTESQRDELEAE